MRAAWIFGVLLLSMAVPRVSSADNGPAIPSASAEQIYQTIDRAIQYLQSESAAWLRTRKCAACHHAPMPLWALAEAQRQGYAIDQKYLTETFDSLLGSRDKLISTKVFPDPSAPPDPRPQGRGLNMALPFLTVAARSFSALDERQKDSLKLITQEILSKQQPDGSWEFFSTLRRPPINESQTTDAAWILLALLAETKADSPENQRTALTKAIDWYDKAKPTSSQQDKALQIIVNVRSGRSNEQLPLVVNDLLELQRFDGGWSQTVPEPKSDAFATGQTLYALSLAGMTMERREFQRGIDFLVATQAADGSWPMTSRSTPNGDEGSATLLTPIICAASSWATLSLTTLAPAKNPGQ